MIKPSVSGNGTVITSGAEEAAICWRLSGNANVTNPAPAIKALLAHKTAAPVMEADPATTNTRPNVPLLAVSGRAGKVYFFDPMNMKIEKGQHVIVETARGVEYGNVVLGIREVEDDKVVLPLKPVIRIATAEDDKKEEANRKKEKEAYKICLEKIAKHKLEMSIHLITIKCSFTSRRTEELTSVNW